MSSASKRRKFTHSLLNTCEKPARQPLQSQPYQRQLLQRDPLEEDPFTEDPPRKDPPRKDPAQREPLEEDPFTKDPPRKDPSQKDPPRRDPLQEDPPPRDPPRRDPLQSQLRQRDPLQEDPPQRDPPRKDPPQNQPPQTHHRLRRRKPPGSHRGGLAGVAQETLEVLPALIEQVPKLDVVTSSKHSFEDPHRLDPSACPSFPRPATIKVVNEDILNAALALADSPAAKNPKLSNSRPALVNFANAYTPGGGWLNGALAQEEVICFRTSLGLALTKDLYPMETNEAIYTGDVLVIRDDIDSGHNLLHPRIPADELPVVSVLTVAAVCRPGVRTFTVPDGRGGTRNKLVYRNDKDRGTAKSKMRLALRMAAVNGHGLLVLGALGCGVFGNPAEDVAHCWLEVLREDEFAGNWWKEVWFAIFDPRRDGNYKIFSQVLDGKEV